MMWELSHGARGLRITHQWCAAVLGIVPCDYKQGDLALRYVGNATLVYGVGGAKPTKSRNLPGAGLW